MAQVAAAEGLTTTMGQSPFAITRGQTFEKALLQNDAETLIKSLIETGVLPAGSRGLVDLRIRMNGGPVASLDVALAETKKVLQHAAERGPAGLDDEIPAVVASATLEIPGQPVMLPDGILAIDALVIRGSEDGERLELLVGEIKSYPYRAGSTDTSELATSRAQAGLYRHALTVAVEALGLEREVEVSAKGMLILSRHGRNHPTVLATEDLKHQAARAEAGFSRLREAAAVLEEFDTNDESAVIRRVGQAGISYRPSCLSFCDRADGCRKASEASGDPYVLGPDVARFLAGVDLKRAFELMEGKDPQNDLELDLLDRIRVAEEGAAS